MKICSKKGCNELPIYKISNGIYCKKHYRFYRLRGGAYSGNKNVPSWNECEILLCVHVVNMICKRCNKQMIWHSSEGNLSDVISLQHNYNGTMEFCCFSCNSKHRNSKLNDQYWEIPYGYKYCPKCEKIKLLSNFHKDKYKPLGLRSYCKLYACELQKENYESIKK